MLLVSYDIQRRARNISLHISINMPAYTRAYGPTDSVVESRRRHLPWCELHLASGYRHVASKCLARAEAAWGVCYLLVPFAAGVWRCVAQVENPGKRCRFHKRHIRKRGVPLCLFKPLAVSLGSKSEPKRLQLFSSYTQASNYKYYSHAYWK